MSITTHENIPSQICLSESAALLDKLDDQIVSYRGRPPIKHAAKQPKPRGRPAKFPDQIGTPLILHTKIFIYPPILLIKLPVCICFWL